MKTLLLILFPLSVIMPVITQKAGLSKKRPLEMKMLCVALFLSVGFLSLFMREDIRPYSIGILSALISGAIGDFLLAYKKGKNFIIGAVFFSVGHLIYSFTFLTLGTLSVRTYIIPVIVIGAVLTALLLIFTKRKIKLQNNRPAFIAYGINLILFLTCAVVRGASAIADKNIFFGLCLIAGGVLFSFSDMLIGAKLGGMRRPKILHYAVSYTYFSAQTLLALSILLEH